MATKKEVVSKNDNELAIIDERPDWVNEDSGRGSEDVTANDITLPRIDVLQALSPQIKRSNANYIEGAEQGQIFNTISGQLYGSEIRFVPVVFKREYIVWQDRDLGGGFRGAFATEQEAEQERRNLENPDSHEVVETHVHFILILHNDGRIEEAVLSMSKSKRKISRKLNSLVQMFPGDRFARVYKLLAVEVDGQKGEYWNFDVAPVGWAPKPIYDKGLATYEAVGGGLRTVDRSYDESTGARETDATV